MKEIRMDFEIYQKEIKDLKNKVKREISFFALWSIANWLEGVQSLNSCLQFEEPANRQIIRIASVLNREHELKNNESESVKKEELA